MKFITLGSDPEFFVLDPKGRPYPATLFAIGTKDYPSQIDSLGEGFYEQRDNLSLEGNIPPANTKEEFIKHMNSLRNYFANKVGRFEYTLSPNGVEYFVKRYLSTTEGMEFGCSSVISLWDSIPYEFADRPTPNLSKCNFRVAGCHLHIGYTGSKELNRTNMDIAIGRLFDLFVTVPSQIIKPEPERIETYGRWGMIRRKPYGVECRTLSSYFTQSEYLPWIWDQIVKIESFINSLCDADLNSIINKRYIVGSTIIDLMYIFKDIFDNFIDKEILNKFDETRPFYEKQNLNKSDFRNSMANVYPF